MKKLMVVLSVALAAGLSFAETYTWTGEGGDFEWTNRLNWVRSNGTHPTTSYNPGYGGNENIIFDPGEGVTLSTTNSMTGWPSNTKFRRIEIRSGTVKVRGGQLMAEATTSTVTGEVYVAENATFDMNCYMGNEGGDYRAVIKSGPGTLILRKRMGYSGPSGGQPFKFVDVREGVFLRAPDSSWSGSAGYGWDHVNTATRCRVHVCAGAEFQWTSYSSVDNIILDLDKGAVARAGRIGSTTLEGIVGEGDIYVIDGTSGSGTVTLALQNDSYAFGGTYSGHYLTLGNANTGAGNTFTLGASNTLAGIKTYLSDNKDCLRFAPGIGEFWINKWSGASYPLNLVDEAGEPVTVHAGFSDTAHSARGVLTGPGSFMTMLSTSTADDAFGYTNGLLRLTGELGSDASGRLVLGRRDAATDPDLSAIPAIRGNGTVVFNTGAPLTFEKPVYSAGGLMASGETTLTDVRKTGGAITANAAFTVAGSGIVSTYNVYKDLMLANSRFDDGKTTWLNEYDTFFKRPRTWGSHVYSYHDGTLVVTNSDVTLGNSTGDLRLGNLTAVDSTVTLLRTSCGCDNDTCPDEIVWTLDNATLRIDPARSPYNFNFPSTTPNKTPSKEIPEWAFEVGPRGARFEALHEGAYGENANHTYYLDLPIRPQAGVTDGGFTFAAPNTVVLQKPVSLTGPITVEGCRLVPQAGAYAAGDDVFGTGDFTIDGGYLAFTANDTSLTPKVAAGAGRTFTYRNANRLQLHASGATANGLTLTVGDPAATAPSLVRGERGVLIWTGDRDGSSLGEPDKYGRFKVNGGMATDAAGRVKDPVFAMSGHLSGGAWGTLTYLSYSAADGFVPFANYTDGLEGGADSVAKVSGTSGRCAVNEGTTTVAALKVSSFGGSDGKLLEIKEGATLRVGNGTDPACVLMDAAVSSVGAAITGKGTLDFGTSEGVIAVARPAGTTAYPARIDATIAGSGGLTVAGAFGVSYSALTLAGANTYTGGTRISCAAVRPANERAFGEGTVEVVGSAANGGQICFTHPVTLSNPLKISGNGINSFALYHTDMNGGALWFLAETTVAGPVEIVGKARVGSRLNKVSADGTGVICDGTPSVGTFTGVISGGTLQLMKSVKPVVLTAANTYTGGTEIVSSTLTLQGPCSVGTGVVTLDQGVLRFENDTPITFTNDFEGVGTIVCAGTAPVTFTGKGLEKVPAILKTLQPGWSFDTPSGNNCTVAVGEDGLDLGGASLAVGTLNGSGRVENGVLTVTGEIRPGGEGAVGTLTFAPGVLVANGATFVCEVGPDGMDKVVVENAFDLAALKLRTVRIGYCHGVEPILSAEALTGEFAETVFAKKSHEISYGETAVTLSVGKGMSLIVR